MQCNPVQRNPMQLVLILADHDAKQCRAIAVESQSSRIAMRRFIMQRSAMQYTNSCIRLSIYEDPDISPNGRSLVWHI